MIFESILSQGYHGLLLLGAADKENVTVTNNYLDGSGITRSWSTSGIFAQGYIRVTIANNEVTRTAGNGIFIKGESLSKGALADGVKFKFLLRILLNILLFYRKAMSMLSTTMCMTLEPTSRVTLEL